MKDEWLDLPFNKKLKSGNPRELTNDEVRGIFIEYIYGVSEEWLSYNKPTKETVEGAIHSILAAIDGCAIGVPGFMLVPDPNSEDKQYHINNGLNWWPENLFETPAGDIAGGLHDAWNARRDR